VLGDFSHAESFNAKLKSVEFKMSGKHWIYETEGIPHPLGLKGILMARIFHVVK